MRRLPHCGTLMLVGVALALSAGCGPTQTDNGAELLPNGQPRPLIIAVQRSGIVVDGDLSDWEGVEFITVTPANGVFDPQPKPTDDPNDLSFRFAVCCDREALYVAVEVTDDDVRADSSTPGATDSPAWDDDAIEIFIDGNHNRAPDSRAEDRDELKYGGEFALIANGAAMSRFSGYPDTFGQADMWQGATNWSKLQPGQPGVIRYEFRLTWAVMGGKVQPGDTIGFTLSAQDDDDGGRRDHALYWVGNPPRLFTDERGFADLHLEMRCD